MGKNNETTSKKLTFWSFLNSYSIEIPVIQRDYAWGREDKKPIRKKILDDIRKAIKGSEEKLLDYVYGSIENGCLQPLDGQQRLTTLWLLHWYIALRTNRLNEDCPESSEICGILRKFTYETRVSSREFCGELCDPKNFKSFDGTKIAEFIRSQTWFHSSWEQDPTISAMLTMLGGTGVEDGIEEVFNMDFEKYWGCLTNDLDCPIKFLHQPLHHFGLSDDLYVKMNARGKPLTSFECFKADLVGYINKKAEAEKEKGEWGELSDLKEGIPIKMDTTWTDIFWKNKSKDCSVDEIYFTFLNRLFMNYRIMDLSGGDEYYEYFNNDTAIVYSSLDNYKWEIEDGEDKGIEIGLFKELCAVLDNYHDFQEQEGEEKLKSIFKCPWGIPFEFIPSYKPAEGGDSSCEDVIPFGFIPAYGNKKESFSNEVKMIQRVVFYAVCKYFNFKDGKADKERLRQWMRFVWNLVSVKIIVDHEMTESYYIGNDINKVKEVIGIIDSIDNYHKVYECLKDLNMEKFIGEKESALFERFKEEKEKACKILEGSEVWKNAIEKAEEYSFFNGGIGFLFRGENGELDDWGSFSQKWENVQKYFRGGKSDTESCMNGEYDNAYLLKTLIGFLPATAAMWNNSEIPLRGCDLKDDVDGRGKPLYNNKAATWRYLLNNKAIYGAVHKLLLGYDLEEIKNGKERSNQRVLWTLSQTKLLDYVITEVKYPLRYRLSDIFEAFFNKGPRIRILMDSYDKNMAFEESLKSRGDIGDLDLHKLYSKGHFICQERVKEGVKEKWSNYKILIPETGNKLPISKYIEDYPEVKKTDSDS